MTVLKLGFNVYVKVKLYPVSVKTYPMVCLSKFYIKPSQGIKIILKHHHSKRVWNTCLYLIVILLTQGHSWNHDRKCLVKQNRIEIAPHETCSRKPNTMSEWYP